MIFWNSNRPNWPGGLVCKHEHMHAHVVEMTQSGKRQYSVCSFIWATYISNCLELCNAPSLIFKCISLWSNYNWAFICFAPRLWGIERSLTPLQWQRNKSLQSGASVSPHCYEGPRVRPGSLWLMLKLGRFHSVTGNENVLFSTREVSQKENLTAREEADESVPSLWQLSRGFGSCC